VTLYVYPEEEAEEIDVAKEWEELKKLEKEIFAVEEKIEGYLREIK
jgi:type I restriction enzyme M protein